jgi:hypothetical protein
MSKLLAMLNDLMTSRFYGELTLKFESGNIVLVQKVEKIKL